MERILVVDDEKSILFALRQYFASHGYVVDCATTAEGALEHLASHQYTAAILDIELRGSSDPSDGLNLARFIRQHASSTAVVILSAHETAEMRERAGAAGAHAFLSKPAPLSVIADVVAIALTREAVSAPAVPSSF